ncbi:M1 family metallopeptidase [Rheinheimera sp.]|uniref:M1 family metallopeptidase n=1 Tax=Rheinheimera sp. TaxID=1869214 RepID=UPI00307F5ADD
MKYFPWCRISLMMSAAVALLAGCQSPAPLDPKVGDTGQPLSVVAQATDVRRYELDLDIDPQNKFISGSGTTWFELLADSQSVELKLDSRFQINRIEVAGQKASYQRDGGLLTIALPGLYKAGQQVKVQVFYQGQPHSALKAPWSGGFVWAKTPSGDPWIATAVQGEGCDLFWPCKDHFGDKADSMRITLRVPHGLAAATNGVLQHQRTLDDGRTEFDWLLSVPASDYNIALNIGPYVLERFSYQGINGSTIPVEFWALPQHKDAARKLWLDDLQGQIQWYEKTLGPYPWGREKIGFVETPHLGMEHQTINAYGKGYSLDPNGYDWLAQHELAHEWFGNLLTHKTLNHAWLHEGFGLYMQPAYALDKLGEAAYRYQMYKAYLGLKNCDPVVRTGVVTSEQAFNSDIYGKGGWVLHTLRALIGDELFWQASRELLYGTADTAKLAYPIAPSYKTTEDFIAIVNRLTGKNYQWLFDVYLYQAELPELMQHQQDGQIRLHWKVPGNLPFPMPVPALVNGELQWLDFSQGDVWLPGDSQLQLDPQMLILRQLPLIGRCDLHANNKTKV